MRARRRELGLTQEELAERAKIDVKTVRMIETGKRTPRPATTRMLADALQVHGEARTHLLGASTPTGTAQPIPAQLPPDVYGFVGRAAHLHTLDALTAAPGNRPPAIALSGSGGIGKTALAVHWAHRVRDRFPDGQLHADLRGFDPGGTVRDPAAVLHGFLGALGVHPERIPASVDERAALYRSLLADRRILVLLDNARDASQVHPLLPGSRGCLVVVTSRDDLAGLVVRHGAHPLGLHLLSEDEAYQLLARRLGADRLAGAPAAVEEIIAHCARLPLALTITAALATTRPDVPLDKLAAELRDAQGRLDTLSVGDPAADVRAVFSWSYRTLSPAAARLFRLLGLHPGPHVSVAAAASLAAEPLVRTRLLLAELTAASLLSERDPGRFAFHDLLRVYASDRAYQQESPDDRDAAVRRMQGHYLHTAQAGDRALATHRNALATPAPPPGTLLDDAPRGAEEALAWFSAEHAVLLAVLHQARNAGQDVHVWHLAFEMSTYLHRKALGEDWVSVQHLAMAAADRLGDRERQVRTHNELAGAYFSDGDPATALDHLQHALALNEALGDSSGLARCCLNTGAVLQSLNRHREALEHYEKALRLFREAGNRAREADALNAVGWSHSQLGDYAAAVAYGIEAVALTRDMDAGDHAGLGAALDSLGYAHSRLGNHEEALRCLSDSLEEYRASGSTPHQAEILAHIGDAHETAGDVSRARDAWRSSLTIYDSLDHPAAVELRAKLR
ncbi:tetratricopeptide repeat protein [Actinoplanes sp. TFC3]|uniref:ATP-binding protein n=1 Tax=Actinoplanes sp. TFC3 TaxID=1710355 RepID=UPI00137A7FA6|nr:helix-turn-helix domain-containing protein [Actinoplanes sp. TFC3]